MRSNFHLCLILVSLICTDIVSSAFALYGTNGAFIELNPLGFEPVAIFLIFWMPYALHITKKKKDDRKMSKLLSVGIILRIAAVIWNITLLLCVCIF